jgi:hypothetical protein
MVRLMDKESRNVTTMAQLIAENIQVLSDSVDDLESFLGDPSTFDLTEHLGGDELESAAFAHGFLCGVAADRGVTMLELVGKTPGAEDCTHWRGAHSFVETREGRACEYCGRAE